MSKIRRDPRLKQSIDDKEESVISKMRDPRQKAKDDSTLKEDTHYSVQQCDNSNWLPNQVNYRQMPMSSSYNTMESQNMYEQRQQYNTAYPPPMNQTQGNYQYSSQEYNQNQYSYYPSMSSDSGYMQAPPPPTWQTQAPSQPPPPPPVSHQQDYHDIPRAPPPPSMHLTPPPSSSNSKRDQKTESTENKKEAALAQEVNQHRATLRKQRDEYYQKAALLKREMDILQSQKREILAEIGADSVPRETQRILNENSKLQLEIQTKLKAITNVIEMLSGIIESGSSDKSKRERSERRSTTPNKELLTTQQLLIDSMKPEYNYVFYDPELHWCRICDVFPTTAKDYLLHLQSEKHRETTKMHKLVDMPWHNLPSEPELPSNPDGDVKRTPIKGIQFFIPSQAWYCKLCDKWIGDLHCASIHLKSKIHIQNFTNFIEQNPHWETDWITDREKAYERAHSKPVKEIIDTSDLLESALKNDLIGGDKDKKYKKYGKDNNRSSGKDKKKKKKSKKRKKVSSESSSASSSSTDTSSGSENDLESDRSRSIRVAMRNKMKMQAQMILKEELGEKLDVLTKLVEDETQRKRQTSTTPTAVETKSKSEKQSPNILPKDKDLFTFNAFRNKMKQTANFKQAQSVSLNLLANKKDTDDKSPSKHRDRSKSQESNGYRRSRSRDKSSRYSTERRSDYRRRYSPDHSSRNRYSRSPDRKRGRRKSFSRTPPRKYDRYDSPERKRRNYRRDSSPDYKRKYEDKFSKKTDKDSSKDSGNKQDKKFNDESKSTDKNELETKSKFSTSGQPKKMPLIGRMPLFKKKLDSEEKKLNENEQNKLQMQAGQSKFTQGDTSQFPAPGLIHIHHLAYSAEHYYHADNPPPPPHIMGMTDPSMLIPEPPQITPFMCEPQMLSMPPMLEPQPEMVIQHSEPEQKGGLPRDLQDALNIIFPGENKDEQPIETNEQEVDTYEYPTYEEYNVPMLPPPIPADMDDPQNQPLDIPPLQPPPEIDDLALLGIDAEDLAAQNM